MGDREKTFNHTGVKTLSNGTKIWYQDGKVHREDGPAVEYADGTTRYYINDRRVKPFGAGAAEPEPEVGPPEEEPEVSNNGESTPHKMSNGTVIWYNEDKKPHRTNGPAVQYADGSARWYVDNHRVYSQDKYQRLTGMDDLTMQKLVDKYGGLK